MSQHIRRLAVLSLVILGFLGFGCGNKNPISSGPDGTDAPGRVAKPLAAPSKHEIGIDILLTRDGATIPNAEIAFARSIAGQSRVLEWNGTTGEDGQTHIRIVADPSGPFWRTGVAGYYIARARDANSGDLLGEWGSIPLNGGRTVRVELPVGGPAIVHEDLTPAPEINFEFAFDGGAQGWAGEFVDMPVDTSGMDLAFNPARPLPAELGEPHSVLYITGMNSSDDLFMFIKRRLDGLNPHTTYSVEFQVRFATSAPAGTPGIGGAPGESVYLKAGASVVEPVRIVETGGEHPHYRLNIDKSNQAGSGRDAIVIGNVAKPTDSSFDRFEFKTLDNAGAPFQITTDGTGSVWALFGTDSGFEGRTEIYYANIRITFREMQ